MIARVIEYCATHRAVVFAATAIAVVGALVAIGRVPLDAIPDLSDPQVIVFTEWMGRSPDLVEDQVTYPIVSSLLAAPQGADGARAVDVRDVLRLRHLRGRHGHLLGAQPRARVLEHASASALPDGRRARCSGPTPPASAGCSSTRWSTAAASTIWRSCAPSRTSHLRYALASVPGRGGGGLGRRLRAPVPGRGRSRPAPRATGSRSATWRRRSAAATPTSAGACIEMAGREYFVRGRGYVEEPR